MSACARDGSRNDKHAHLSKMVRNGTTGRRRMNIAIILSGGTGTRLGGDIPKQYTVTGGRSMIARAMEPFFWHARIDAVQIVADSAYHGKIREDVEDLTRFRGFSAPGETRALSILNALRDIASFASDDDIVIIHDAARPFVSLEQISDLIDACREHDGALPVLPMKDTVYLLPESTQAGIEMLDRSRIVAGQAPEAFRFGKYLAANEALLPDRIKTINGSTEPALLAGMDIVTIPGDEKNLKVTTKEDLARYIRILDERKTCVMPA